MFSIWNLAMPFHRRGPNAENACRWLCPGMKPRSCYTTCKGYISWWPNCSMVPDCVWWSASWCIDPRSGNTHCHHVLSSGLQKSVRAAVRRAGLGKRVTCHTFRHSYATHLLENSLNIRVVQELMGHADVKTTEIYTHVMQKNLTAVESPLDRLFDAQPGKKQINTANNVDFM